MIRDLDIQKCVELIREADCVLIGAGSGITVDAGYNYADQEAFARDYPGMVKLGFRMKAELIGYTGRRSNGATWPPTSTKCASKHRLIRSTGGSWIWSKIKTTS